MTWKLVISEPSSLMMNPEPNPLGVRTCTTASPRRLTSSRTERSGVAVVDDWKSPDLLSIGGETGAATFDALPLAGSGGGSLVIRVIWFRGTISTVYPRS